MFVCVLCFCVCFVFFFSSTTLSRVLALLADYGQPAPIQSFRRVAEFFAAGLAYQTPYLASTGPLACFFFFWSYYLLTRRQPARQPYSIIPQLSCGILCCCWFFCHIKPPISPSTGPLACRDLLIYAAAKILPPPPNGGLSRVLVLLTDRQPYLIIPQSCGICQGGRLLSSPYLAEYGQYTWEGFNVKKQNKTK